MGGGRRAVREKASPDFPHKFNMGGGGGGGRGRGERGRRGGGRSDGTAMKPKPSAESKAVQEAYGPVESGSRKDPPLLPIV